ncbi:hypothetical protein [Adlercreutzia sp. ZJ141]|uniref:hypothetical protein n=1 Tax=Adlercreutzia sp. ZJ141 TaxID=2709406 RepID=UPI0013ECFBC8|nr:hypothetical protein [Adlercreutzia sp. ZJ141]
MITITEDLLDRLPAIRKTNLESQIVMIIGERLDVSPAEALDVYYSSDIARMVEQNLYGMQYLEATYLADEILMRMGQMG